MKEAPLLVLPGSVREVLTTDHLTPRCIAKRLHWRIKAPSFLETPQERFLNPSVNDPDNLHELPWKRHREKDATTPWELQAVKRNGGAKTLFEHHNEYVILRKGLPEGAKL